MDAQPGGARPGDRFIAPRPSDLRDALALVK